MNILDSVPLTYYLNRGRADQRRYEIQFRLMQAGIDARRFPAIDPSFVKRFTSSRGSVSAYASVFSKILAIRAARQMGNPSVLLLEDDVALASDIQSSLRRCQLPDDWGILYLGCTHLEKPIPVSSGLVRVAQAVGGHAIAIRREYYKNVISSLRSSYLQYPNLSENEVFLALQAAIPTYAVYPNLCWPDNKSDLADGYAYDHRGRQLLNKEAVEGLWDCSNSVNSDSSEACVSEPESCFGLKVGGHPISLRGWQNTSIDVNSANIDEIIAKLNNIDAVFEFICIHNLLEYFPEEDGKELLKLCCSKLRPGGVLRVAAADPCFPFKMISEPDEPKNAMLIEWIRQQYFADYETISFDAIANHLVDTQRVKFLYTRENFSEFLRSLQLSDIKHVGDGISQIPGFSHLESVELTPPELYALSNHIWEARRPG